MYIYIYTYVYIYIYTYIYTCRYLAARAPDAGQHIIYHVME